MATKGYSAFPQFPASLKQDTRWGSLTPPLQKGSPCILQPQSNGPKNTRERCNHLLCFHSIHHFVTLKTYHMFLALLTQMELKIAQVYESQGTYEICTSKSVKPYIIDNGKNIYSQHLNSVIWHETLQKLIVNIIIITAVFIVLFCFFFILSSASDWLKSSYHFSPFFFFFFSWFLFRALLLFPTLQLKLLL